MKNFIIFWSYNWLPRLVLSSWFLLMSIFFLEQDCYNNLGIFLLVWSGFDYGQYPFGRTESDNKLFITGTFTFKKQGTSVLLILKND